VNLSIPKVIIAISVLAAVSVLGGYGAYEFQRLRHENEELKSVRTAPQIVIEATSTSTSANIDVDEAPEVPEPPAQKAAAKKKEVAAPAPKKTNPIPQPSPEPAAQAAAAGIPERIPESEPANVPVQESTPLIQVVRVAQTAYPDGYGGVYGSYGMTIRVTAQGGDVLIPMTTSDSIGIGLQGFSYSLVGGAFRGRQDSDIDCSVMSNNFCKVKEGQTKDIKVTVWLIPMAETDDGNYAIEFSRVLYLINGTEHTLDVNKRSQNINVYY